MTYNLDGTATCDRCGNDIGNAGIDKAIAMNALLADGTIVTLHMGIACPSQCTLSLISEGALDYRMHTRPVTFFNPNSWAGFGAPPPAPTAGPTPAPDPAPTPDPIVTPPATGSEQ